MMQRSHSASSNVSVKGPPSRLPRENSVGSVGRRSPSPHPKPLRPLLYAALTEGYGFGAGQVVTVSEWCCAQPSNFKLLYESTYSNGTNDGIRTSCHGCLPLFVILSSEDGQVVGGFHTSTLFKSSSFLFSASDTGLTRHDPTDSSTLKKRVTIDTPTTFGTKDLVITPSSGIVSSVFDRYHPSGSTSPGLFSLKTTAKLRHLHVFWAVPVEELTLCVLAGAIASLAPPPKTPKPLVETPKETQPVGVPVISRPVYSYAEGCVDPAPPYDPPPPQPPQLEEEDEYEQTEPGDSPSPGRYGPYSHAYAMHTYMPTLPERSPSPPSPPKEEPSYPPSYPTMSAPPEDRSLRASPGLSHSSSPPLKRSRSLGSTLPPPSFIFTEKKYYKPAPAVRPPEYFYYGSGRAIRKPALPVEATRVGRRKEKRSKTPPARKGRLNEDVAGPAGIMGGGKIHWSTPGGWESKLCGGRSAKYDAKVVGGKKKKKKKGRPVWREEVEELLRKEREDRPVVCPVTGLTYRDFSLLDARRDAADKALMAVGVPHEVLLYNYYNTSVRNDVAAEHCSQQWLVEVLKWAEGAGGPRFRDDINMVWRTCLDDDVMWEGQVLSPPRVDRTAPDPDVFQAYFAKRHPSLERGDSRVTLQKNCHAGCVRLSSRRSSSQSLNPTQSILDFKQSHRF